MGRTRWSSCGRSHLARAVLLAVLVGALSILGALPASAHASLVSADPPPGACHHLPRSSLSPFHHPMLANAGRRRYAHRMTICYIASPVGRLALEADGEALSAVRWAGEGESAPKSRPESTHFV